jgi:hypothetical protein
VIKSAAMVKGCVKKASSKATTKGTINTAMPVHAKAPKNLLEVLEGKHAAKKASVPKLTEDAALEKKVAKAIADTFGDFSKEQTDELLVNGMTLRQTLLHDRKHATPEQKFGMLYYGSKRSAFESTDSPAKKLVVADPKEDIPTALGAAMGKMLAHNCAFTPMMDFFASCTTMNQRSFVFMLRGLLKVSPYKNPQARDTIVAALKWMQHRGMQTKFKAEFEIMKPHFDCALACSLESFKHARKSGGLWWKSVSKYAALVLPADDFDKILGLGPDDTFDNVLPELDRVVKTEVGSVMFSAVAGQQTARLVSKKITEEVEKLRKISLSQAVLDASRDNFLQFCEDNDIAPSQTKEESEVTVKYRTVSIAFKVQSFIQEYNVAIYSLVATAVVESGAAKALFCEDQLVEDGRFTKEGITVTNDLAEPLGDAREQASEFVAEVLAMEQNLAFAIKSVLVQRDAVLQQIYPGWVVEKSFFNGMMGARGEERFRSQILGCLPAVDNDISLTDSAASLKQLRKSDLYKFVNISCQTKLANVLGYVENIHQHQQPAFSQQGDTKWMDQVKPRLALFCELAVGEGLQEILHGKPAVERMFEALASKATHDADESIRLPDLAQVYPFEWLLNANQVKQLADWREEALQCHPAECGSSLPSSSSAAPAAKKKQKKSGDDTMKELLLSLAM